MCGKVRVGGKILSTVEAAKRLEALGLSVDDFSEAMHVFNLEFPFVVAIISSDGHESSIQGSSQKITESEAV